jgi:hypothetical protein
VQTWAWNQREQNVMPGSAVIRLPRRADGSGDGQEENS